MKAIVTGSFDPMTVGHLELLKYAANKYDEVYIVALVNDKKNYMFTMEQKKAIMKATAQNIENVVVDSYKGLTADYMHEHGIAHIVRGIRSYVDLPYEIELATIMKSFDSSFETEIVEFDESLVDTSSTTVRNKIKNGESLDGFVHTDAIELIKQYTY